MSTNMNSFEHMQHLSNPLHIMQMVACKVEPKCNANKDKKLTWGRCIFTVSATVNASVEQCPAAAGMRADFQKIFDTYCG